MTLLLTSLYVLVVVSFLLPLVLALLHWRQHQAPLALKFIKQSLGFAAFVVALFVTYLLLEALPEKSDQIELFFDSAYFALYAMLTVAFSRLFFELLQKPWQGRRRVLVEALAILGLVLVFLIHALVYEGNARLSVLRLVLNGVYLPLYLGWLLYLFGLALVSRSRVEDPWKKTTVTGSAVIFVASIPLFVIDALWPLFQVEWHLIPRGLNLHIAGVLVWNGFWAWRWLTFQPQPPEPSHTEVAPPELPEDLPVLAQLTSREREVARWVLAGYSNQLVAETLGLGIGTVKNHLYHIFNKTGASSRKELKRMVSS